MLHRTTCSRDCPDACGILATVEDGRVVRIQGDPAHPVTRGFLCERTNRDYPARLNDPARLRQPLRRRGESFEPVSWDVALDEIAAAMLRFRAESGGASIFHYRSGGSLGVLRAVVDRFFARFGPVSVKGGDICSGAGDEAQVLDFGDSESSDLFDLRHARTILLWGKNPFISNVHLLPLLREARARGVRLLLIDPIRHRGADLCERTLQPRPGSDFELAMAVSRLLLERGAWHPDAASWCANLPAHRALVESRSVGDWLAATGLARAEAEALADAYAAGPATILVGWGMQRRANGGGIVRALDALAAVTGNVGIPGAGVSFYFARRAAFDLDFGAPPPAPPRQLLEPLFASELLAAADPPVRMVWIDHGNPVTMLPGSRQIAAALRSRELVVVVDSFLTDSARCADFVLPCATMLEDDDLLGAYGHHWLGEQRPVVPPPPGVKTDLEIVRALARRVGLAAEFDIPAVEWKRRALARVAPRGVTLETLRAGALRNPEAAEVLYTGRRFRTADGLAHLIDAPPPHVPALDAEWPLYLTAISASHSQCSQGEWPRTPGPPEARVHPASAGGRGDGARAIIESRLGRLEVILRHDPRLHPSVLHVDKGGWLAAGRCANALIRPRPTDLGGGACYYDERVRLVTVTV